MTWALAATDHLTADLLDDLFENRIGAVRVPNFVDMASTRAAAAGILERKPTPYENVDPPIGRIGITQFEHCGGALRRAAYFDLARDAEKVRREVFAGAGDPVDSVVRALDAAWEGAVGIAEEPDGSQYFAGLVRVIGEGLLHCDWAPYDAPAEQWSIGRVSAQITWNIYCQMPSSGGATVVYNRPWTADAQAFQIPGSYGYREDLVSGREQLRIDPGECDLVLFNSRNFHRIESGVGAARLSVSSFVGRHADGSLVLWS